MELQIVKGFSINKSAIEGRYRLNIHNINDIRKLKSHLKICEGIEKFEIMIPLLQAVKNSAKWYKERCNAEKCKESRGKKRKLIAH